MAKDNDNEIPYESPLSKIPYTQGLLDYLVPDQIEKNMLTALAREGEKQNTYGGFTPKVEANTPQGLSNIETLLGTAYMPQAMTYSGGKGPSNKQMINAAILRAGLELGKGRLPGENFGVALNRGMEAFGAPAKTLADAQAAAAAARAKGMRPQVSVSTPKYAVFNSIAKNLYDNNQIFQDTVNSLTGNKPWNFSSPTIKALAGNAISYQSEYGGSIENAIMKSAEGMVNLKTVDKTNSNSNDSANSNSDSSDASKPKISEIIIK